VAPLLLVLLCAGTGLAAQGGRMQHIAPAGAIIEQLIINYQQSTMFGAVYAAAVPLPLSN
jgi:hypothetical protein